MTLAREGIREMLVCTALFGGGAALCSIGALQGMPLLWAPAVPLFALWVFTIAFFRDPHRDIPDDPGALVSPADGKVTEITRLDAVEGIEGPAIRIGIFLSVFDVHINRTPCAARVIRTVHQPGVFLDARHPESGIRNESNTIFLEPAADALNPIDSAHPAVIVVRQVAGLIARRIICTVGQGQWLQRGQRIGLIKFGSRTELIVPMSAGLEPAVHVNDRVQGGSTILFRSAMRTSRSAEATEQRRSRASQQE